MICVAGEIVLFREIRVCRDRIVKVWRWFGEREVAWAHASVQGYGNKVSSHRLRWVSDGRMKIHPVFSPGLGTGFLPPFRGVLFNECDAEPEDVRKLNAVLAEISERNVEEFEPLWFKMDLFIKDLIIDEAG